MSHERKSRGFKFSEGDWTCPGCGNVNFARRMQCNRCGEEKKVGVKKIKSGGIQIGKQAAEKSKGLFSADDWMCKTCGNVNWARRSECNMCNTPRVGLQDERTGLGGGFNERGTVEYKEKQESDDEFDEFGRRKRSKKNGSVSSLPARVENDTADDEEEDDDEDDEDEDGDLSKYDLDGDDDDDEESGDASKYDLAASDSEDEKSRSSSASSSRSSSPSRKRKYSSSSDSDSHNRSVDKKQRPRGKSSSPRH